MQDRPTERVRVLLDGLTASAIVDRIHPYYSGYQFDGEWLDTLRESIEGELDDLDRIIRGRAGTVEREAMEERTAAYNEGYDAGFASADDWADQHEDAMAKHGWVRLPVDADGVPIHVGDVMDGYGKTIEVVELRYGRSGWVLISRDGNAYADCAAFTHHHAPTVENVLEEFVARWMETHHDDIPALKAKYAAKLRLAGDE